MTAPALLLRRCGFCFCRLCCGCGFWFWRCCELCRCWLCGYCLCGRCWLCGCYCGRCWLCGCCCGLCGCCCGVACKDKLIIPQFHLDRFKRVEIALFQQPIAWGKENLPGCAGRERAKVRDCQKRTLCCTNSSAISCIANNWKVFYRRCPLARLYLLARLQLLARLRLLTGLRLLANGGK